MRENLFFFGTWLTDILRSFCGATPLRGLKRFTCRPTLIFLVSAPWGKTACTWGTTVLETIPPSGPMACTSWRTRETTAKYCGKSFVKIRVRRPEHASSIWLKSKMKNNKVKCTNYPQYEFKVGIFDHLQVVIQKIEMRKNYHQLQSCHSAYHALCLQKHPQCALATSHHCQIAK